MPTVGGSAVVDRIGDPPAAAAFVDTVFYQGPGGGPKIFQQAVNDVRESLGMSKIAEDGQMGPGTVSAYRDLLQTPGNRQALLDALAARRNQWSAKRSNNQDRLDSDARRFNSFQ